MRSTLNNPLGVSSQKTSRYSRVPNITVGLNKSLGVNFSWKLIKSSTVVFRFKHVRFKEDFRFKQDFTLPKMEE